jgi:hypothetical protein
MTQLAVTGALRRLDDLHACWRWLRSLAHRLDVAVLRFEHVGIDWHEVELLSEEIGDFNQVSHRLADASRRGRASTLPKGGRSKRPMDDPTPQNDGNAPRRRKSGAP